MARLLAKAVNCLDEDVDQRPCNRCRICQSINEGRLLDLIEMDAASHTGVDNVREAIRDKVGFRPGEARYKVYVIDEVHMLSTSAFNALLKTLEEPPEHVIFCLATTEPHKILPTIVSRCQRFDFRRIPRSAIVARLRFIAEQEEIQFEDEALGFVARSATGSMRDAISLLDQLTAYGDERITVERLRAVLGLSDVELIYQLANCMVAHEVGQGLALINQAVVQGADVRQFTQQVVEYLRQALIVQVGGSAASTEMDARTRAEIDTLVGQCSARELLRAVQLFNQAQLDLRGHDQGQLALELAFVEAALAPAPPTEPEQSLREGGGVSAAYPASPAPAVPHTQPVPVLTEKAQDAQEIKSSVASRGAAPPPAPPRASPKVPKHKASDAALSEPGLQTEAVSEEYIKRMQNDVSAFLRQEGSLGSKASGLFSTALFSAGKIRVLGGNEILLGVSAVLLNDMVTGEITRLVERALCSVLNTNVRVRFVDRERVDEYEPLQPESRAAADAARPATGSQLDPIEEAKSDPVVQNLIRHGGQVTNVELLE
jgi:DNA polymerase-3 subunit gamma/tau